MAISVFNAVLVFAVVVFAVVVFVSRFIYPLTSGPGVYIWSSANMRATLNFSPLRGSPTQALVYYSVLLQFKYRMLMDILAPVT